MKATLQVEYVTDHLESSKLSFIDIGKNIGSVDDCLEEFHKKVREGLQSNCLEPVTYFLNYIFNKLQVEGVGHYVQQTCDKCLAM